MEDNVTAETGTGVGDVVKNMGMLFYIINPGKTSHPTVEQCPNYLQQMMPYMGTLIVLEAVVRQLLGHKHNVADSVTSISSGLVMTVLGMLTQGLVISAYIYIHANYRLVNLAWDSPVTWVVAALLIDLGYYWFHRASHEVAVLWAVHQHHHSSEEFNLTTAFRQPWFQGLFQIHELFYLPAALFVPPTHFIIHTQFVFLFQFWIHTELAGDLGPLGLIFNTSSFHQVHHGANRYCLDKNYAGVLIIWDRIFGTFEPLHKDEELVYGLISQPQFFNIIKHQFFYFKILYDKACTTSTWYEWFSAFLQGPGWFPGTPRLGDPEGTPVKPEREKHYSSLSTPGHLYLIIQLLVIFVIHDDLDRLETQMSQSLVLAVMVFIIWTLTSVSLHYDRDPLVTKVEVSRCLLSLAMYRYMGGWQGSTISPVFFTVWITASLAVTLWAAQGKKEKVA